MPYCIAVCMLPGFAVIVLWVALNMKLLFPFSTLAAGVIASSVVKENKHNASSLDTRWYAPGSSGINNLSTVINGTGVYGFIFNSSTLPSGVPYGTYNWCNMPHVRPTEYPMVNESYELVYVEVIHRHHKRTPYAANTFPVEAYPWECSDSGLFYYGSPLPVSGANSSAHPYWSVYTSEANPLRVSGFQGSCQFPQITRGGLDDSRQHGQDLASVYRDKLGFLPAHYDPTAVSFRVTNNVITSQVAGMVLAGMFPDEAMGDKATPLLIQPPSIDSLGPTYDCPAATESYSSFATGSQDPAWTKHLNAAATLYAKLDNISGVPSNATDWHVSFDHYFDNLSSRLCHDKPLPCNVTDPKLCVTSAQAAEVFRLGEYEYSYTYRDGGQQTLDAAVGSFGIWVAELSQNLRHAINPKKYPPSTANETSGDNIRYRHNVAHDNSLSRLLSILQVDTMVWPGMGSEVVFELYREASAHGSGNNNHKQFYVRVLWGGQVLESSSPTLGRLNMIPVDTLLAYFDALVGMKASKIPSLCGL